MSVRPKFVQIATQGKASVYALDDTGRVWKYVPAQRDPMKSAELLRRVREAPGGAGEEMQPEYDIRGGVRGKYHERYQRGAITFKPGRTGYAFWVRLTDHRSGGS